MHVRANMLTNFRIRCIIIHWLNLTTKLGCLVAGSLVMYSIVVKILYALDSSSEEWGWGAGGLPTPGSLLNE
jgi:hypothetical protein